MPPRRWDLGEVLKLFLSSPKVSMENPATLASRRNLTASYLERGFPRGAYPSPRGASGRLKKSSAKVTYSVHRRGLC